jgi:hypothetical protein
MEVAMNMRLSRLAVGGLVVAAAVLMAGQAWAVYWDLGPSKDEWKMKYDVQVTPAEGKKLNVVFTLEDAGRLAPIYSATVIALTPPGPDGGSSYDVKAPIEFKIAKDGTASGQVQIGKQYLNAAKIRILTLTFDGKKQTGGARFYDIPLKKFMDQAPAKTAQAPKSKPVPAPRIRIEEEEEEKLGIDLGD